MVIFFDIDDTLINHSAAIQAATVLLHKRVNLPVTLEACAATWDQAHRRHYPRFLSGEASYETVIRARVREAIDADLSDEESAQVFRGYLADYAAAWSLFPDVLPCLDRLKAFRLGIISNGRSDEQRRKLAAAKLADRFEHVLVSEDCGHAKPSATIFRLAYEAVRVSPLQAVYVGDQYELDACGARNAGLLGIWLDRRGVASPDHCGPMIGSLKELPHALESATV